MSVTATSAPAQLTDSDLAGEIKGLLAGGERPLASARFEVLIERHQRRATRIAYYYLRDAAEVDEAVQDAFLKAFLHLPSFREELLFELWFTKILVNGCLDRIKARNRRLRWLLPTGDSEYDIIERRPAGDPSPEKHLLAQERARTLRAAVQRLPERQRSVVVLTQFEGHSTRDVSAVLGLNETTVRVHLFRAIRSLRKHLSDQTWLSPQGAASGIAKPEPETI